MNLNRSITVRVGIACTGLVGVGAAVLLFTEGAFDMRTDEYLKGQTVYFDHCAVCHAPDGSGVDFQGVPLVGNAFIRKLTDEELKTFIIVGRPTDSLDSVMEEPKLGVDYLREDDYEVLIQFLRRLNTQ